MRKLRLRLNYYQVAKAFFQPNVFLHSKSLFDLKQQHNLFKITTPGTPDILQKKLYLHHVYYNHLFARENERKILH